VTKLIKSGAYTQDAFAPVADDAPLPEGAVLGPRWPASRKSARALLARNTPIGHSPPIPRKNPEILGADVKPLFADRFGIFPNSATAARSAGRVSWRTRLGFTGEIRAVGDFSFGPGELPAPRRLRRLGSAR